MNKKKYVIATLFLIIFIQIICIVVVETLISLSLGSNINIVIWRYAMIGFIVMSIVFIPVLVIKIQSTNASILKNTIKQLKQRYEYSFAQMKGEIYAVNDKNRILWLSTNAEKRVKSKDVLVNASFINKQFKLAYENPGKKFMFLDDEKVYQVHFNREINTYFCMDITEISDLNYKIFKNAEVVGFLEIRDIHTNNLESIDNSVKSELVQLIHKWAGKYSFIVTYLGDLCFMINMRQKDLFEMTKNEFVFIKEINKYLSEKEPTLIIQASFASSRTTSLENAEDAKKGLSKIRSTKKQSMVAIQNYEENSFLAVEIGKDNDENDKATSVMPVGYSYQNLETIKRQKSQTPITIDIIAKEQETKVNNQFFEQNKNELGVATKKKVPDWLKKILENNSKDRIEPEDKPKAKVEFNHSLLNEIQKMQKVICYLANGNNKDELLVSVLLSLIASKLGLEYYVYSEEPFNIHHTVKSMINKAGLTAFSKSIMDAYTFKRLNKINTFYGIIRKNEFNKDLVNITVNHRIAYIKDSFSKKILETLVDSIKVEVKKLDFEKREIDLILFLAKRIKNNEAESLIKLFQEIKKTTMHDAPM